MNRFLVFPAIALLCLNGCVEARLRLRDDSPLPSWVRLPDGATREQVQVQILSYSDAGPGWKVKFIVRPKDHKSRIIQRAEGRADWHADSLATGTTNFPNWTIVDVNGTKQVYQQTQFNDLLKIVEKKIN